MIAKLLIANRGGIACRVAAVCRKSGTRTVAVYSDTDVNARHVAVCDETIHIDKPATHGSYLRAGHILEVARTTGAQAVHPGYGFSSENEAFARICADAGIIFVGPSASTIEAMGSKSAAKALTETAGVSLVPGYYGDNQDTAFLRTQANCIGYPVLIKASADGGGKDMCVVELGDVFEASLASVKHEMSSSLDDDRAPIEKYLTRPCHIEIQVFANNLSDAVYLSGRNYSVQHRNQEVLEETPAPGMMLDRCRATGEAVVTTARTVDHVDADTTEFIIDEDGTFYFMKISTHLQIEHPVVEMIAGEDPAEWQLRVAFGESLPHIQDGLHIRGHAFEARIYVENPDRGFLPSIDMSEMLRTPTAVEFAVGVQANGKPAAVHIDTGVRESDTTNPYYDLMIVKLTVWDRDRGEVLTRMLQALGSLRLVGLSPNVAFLRCLVVSKPFATADLDTGPIAHDRDTPLPATPDMPLDAIALAVAVLLARKVRSLRTGTRDPYSPRARGNGWCLNGAAERTLRSTRGDQSIDVTLIYGRRGSRLEVDDSEVSFASQRRVETFTVTLGTHKAAGQVHADGDMFHVFTDGAHWMLERHDPLAHAGEVNNEGGKLTAPMSSKVVAVLVTLGQTVTRGAPLATMRAMKMEHMFTAPANGVVESALYGMSDQVMEGMQLLASKPAE